MEHFDVIVIGTGAGGSTLVHRLAPTGARILVLERGDFIPREVENWDPRLVAEGRYRPQEEWLDAAGNRFRPYTHYCVGGNTKMFGAALLRLRESDFGEVRHYGGVSPAWPISYADLEPYYARAEALYSVHGARGTDPCEPPASGPYPHPALDHEPGIEELFADLSALGTRPFPLPVGIRLPDGGRNGASPVRPSRFDGYPDPTEAKADAQVVALSPALARENVTLLTRARATRLGTDASGRRVTGVVVERDGQLQTLTADLVVVACGAINSAALLLRSGSDQHPHGLGNSSGLVGRNYMTHNNGALVAVTRRRNGARFQKTLALTDYYRSAPDSDLPLGCVQMMGRMDASELAGLLQPEHPDIDAASAIDRSFEFWLTAEDLPDAENRVALAADGSIVLHRQPSNREAYDRLKARLIGLLDRVFAADGGAIYVGYDLGIGGVSHQCGTLRFGSDARSSVLDLDCRAHDLDNLYVCDGSFFPASGAVNPALTIAANALRVGDHLAARLGRP